MSEFLQVSNEFSNFAVQSAFIKSISEPVIGELRSILPVLSNTEQVSKQKTKLIVSTLLLKEMTSSLQYMRFIGITGSDDPDIISTHRSQIAFSIQFLLAISRRTACPLPDLTKCRQGGFIYTGAGMISTFLTSSPLKGKL
jgi:hypothetical protein